MHRSDSARLSKLYQLFAVRYWNSTHK